MDCLTLQPQLLLGLEKHIKGNVHYLNNDEIIYPVGTVVTIHNYATKKQRYIRMAQRGQNIVQINLSPDRNWIAISERSDKGPIITIWNPATFKKRKTITISSDNECKAAEFACFEFSFDSRYIVAVAGEPDWTFYNIKWEKGRTGRVESSARAINLNGTGTIESISCNPNDTNQLALCGDHVLRCVGCEDYVWRQFGYNKLDPAHYTSCSWLSQDRLIIGSSRGKIIIMETGEIRAVLHASDLPLINMKLKDDDESAMITDPTFYDSFGLDLPPSREDYAIRQITTFPKGFVFTYMNGKIHVYEAEDPHRYRKQGVLIVPNRYIERDDEEPQILNAVNTITINPSGDRVIVSCKEMQLWTKKIFAFNKYVDTIDMNPFGFEQHLGPIADIAMCRWKPIALTIGAMDRTVKVWNYETAEIEMTQVFEDDIYSVDLHPTGLYAVMGFSDKLRFMTVLIDEIATTKEFNIRACERCRFSRMGHLFAAANTNVIQVFSTVTFQLLHNLKGHSVRITGLDWSANDNVLASCGAEGAMYLWDVAKSTRISETVIKTNLAKAIRIFNDGSGFYCVGKDSHIREVSNTIIQRDVIMPVSTSIDVLVLSALDNIMFTTANDGSIFIVQLPLLEKIEYEEFTLHKTSVVQAVLSYDDKYLLSGSKDGCIFFWRLLNAEDKAIKNFEFVSYNEILMSKQMLGEKMDLIRSLTIRMNELENEHSYQMKKNDELAASKMKDIHTNYCNAIDELKLKNDQMEADHIQEINNINAQIAQLKRGHTEFIEKLEANFNAQVMSEFEKFIAYEQRMEKTMKEAKASYDMLQKAKEDSEAALIEDYGKQLDEKDRLYDELMKAKHKQEKNHELIKQQIEDDADREIYELKENHHNILKEEQDLNMRLRSEIATMKKIYVVAQREMVELKKKVFTMDMEHSKLKGFIFSLEQEINDMKKEIHERNQTIDDKEKRIYSLKNKNQELEKFKFILDFQIKELKSQIEPKERIITEQTTQINKMIRELENLQKIILSLDVQLNEHREKLNACNNEVRKEMDKNRLMKKSLQDIRIDIHEASGVIQNIPLLQKVVRTMYHKYNADKDFEVAQQEDTEAKSEFLRQRDFLERAVGTLHYQATKNTSSLSYDKIRLVDENAALLEETNELRKNLQMEVEQNRKLTSLAGMSRMTAQQAKQRVNFATATNKEIHKQYKDKLELNTKTLAAMKDENARLVKKITDTDVENSDNKI